MGVIDNFRRIIQTYQYKNKERTLEREVTSATIEDSNFYKEFGAFSEGLSDYLDTVLVKEGNSEVVIKPLTANEAKYFRAALDDDEFNSHYIISKTSGGEFSFKLRDMTINIEDNYDKKTLI